MVTRPAWGIPAAPDAGGCRGDRDGADLPEAQVEVVDLGNEDGGHGLVESSPVHVDGGADGKDKPADPGVHLVLGLQQSNGDREGGAARPRPECRGESVGHVGNELEGKVSRDHRIDCWQDHKAVNEQTCNRIVNSA